MKLLMLSGDRATCVGERGPFFYLQEVFSRFWDRIDVLCPRPDRAPTVRVIHDRVHLHPSTGSRLFHVGYLVREGRRLLAEHRHEVIVSHDYGIFSNGRAAARLARVTGVPWMSEIFHVPGVPRAANLRERIDPWLARTFVRHALRNGVGAFRVMNRRETPNFLRAAGAPDEKIRFLSALYLDLDTFSPRVAVAKKWDVAFVGRLYPNKGAGTILDALAQIHARRPALRAVFVGKGPEKERLEARARARGLGDAVTFIEWLATKEDLANVYRESRLLVCASFNEGGPRVTCEAMACGTPCVSTPIGVMPDLIEHGENGWLFDFDAGSLARSLDEALGDPARLARAASRCRSAVEKFDGATTIRLYAEGLQSLVRPKGSPAAVAAASP